MGTVLRLIATVFLSLLASGLAVGCEARVSLGARCELASDCPPSMVCKMGRCRNECFEARDCAFPAECMVEGTVGGCRVPEDAACGDGMPACATGLVCHEGRCAQECDGQGACAAGQVCQDRVCVRNTTVGECDVLSGAGCPDGQRCGIRGSIDMMTGVDSREVGCVMLTSGELRDAELDEPCDANPETIDVRPCRDGLTCVANRCMRWCLYDQSSVEAGSSCGPGMQCVPSIAGTTAPTTCGFCTEIENDECDPASPTGCGMGIGCGMRFESATEVRAACELAEPVDCVADPSAEGCPFQRCTDTARCAVGSDCLEVLGNGAAAPALCFPYCDETGTCPADSVCVRGSLTVRVQLEGRMAERGVCMPTCSTGFCPTPDELFGDAIVCDDVTDRCMQPCTDDTQCFGTFVCDTMRGVCVDR
jgi:hypothetical protein